MEFEIIKDGFGRFVRLKSHENAQITVEGRPGEGLRLPTVDQPSNILKYLTNHHFTRPLKEKAFVFQQIGDLNDLDFKLSKIAAATERLGTPSHFVFLMDEQCRAEELALAMTKIKGSGLDTNLVVAQTTSSP